MAGSFVFGTGTSGSSFLSLGILYFFGSDGGGLETVEVAFGFILNLGGVLLGLKFGV